jgi:hypothetical protein
MWCLSFILDRQSEARGQAREIADLAAGQFERLVQPARGEAERFTRVLSEARKSDGSFRRRLFLETMALRRNRGRNSASVFGDEAGSPAGEAVGGGANSAGAGRLPIDGALP